MKKLGRRRRARCSEVMRRRCAAYLRNLRRGRGGSAEAMFGSKTILKSVSPTRTLKLSPFEDLSDARFRLHQRRFFATTKRFSGCFEFCILSGSSFQSLTTNTFANFEQNQFSKIRPLKIQHFKTLILLMPR